MLVYKQIRTYVTLCAGESKGKFVLLLQSSAYIIATFLAMLHQNAYMTGPEKTDLIYIKYTYSYYSAYLSLHSLYLNSVSFTEQLEIF